MKSNEQELTKDENPNRIRVERLLQNLDRESFYNTIPAGVWLSSLNGFTVARQPAVFTRFPFNRHHRMPNLDSYG